MKRTLRILFITFAAFAVLAVTGCDDGGNDGGDVPADGTLTIEYTGDGSANGLPIVAAVIGEGNDPMQSQPLGFGGDLIDSGNASFTLTTSDESASWSGTGGTTYDVYIFIDSDGDDEPSTGDLLYKTFDPSVQYTQDGNEVVSVNYSDFNEMQ